MKYIIKQMVDGQEELLYTKHFDELERKYFNRYLEEKGIDDEDEFEEEGGDIDELWDDFYESDLYKEFNEFIKKEDQA